MIAYVGTSIVGAVFLVTGIMKALNAKAFITHVFSYGILPPRLLTPIAIGYIGMECALGMALILQAFLSWLIPGALALLLGLSTLTLWAAWSGRTANCHCYGGLLDIKPWQSIGLNLGYGFCLAVAWLDPVRAHQTAPWQGLVALGVGVLTVGLAWWSRHRLLINVLLHPGRRWKQHWLKATPLDLQSGTHLVMFLSPQCTSCHQWLQHLNVLSTQKDSPPLLGITALNPEEIAQFKANQQVWFPVVAMDAWLFGAMVDFMPTFILLKDGVIANKWVNQIPNVFIDRIQQVYERLLAKNT